ncbi:hypothetical protein J1N35_022311 [Gossypium stocksii]|uniref:Uncharacterized protein n=1 Tax=Gossypium stocksii TaxID=47602 RepID=A0A9D3VFW2_9ROSI|nr:hypothetical protein J1N35_022311 [Gossypium stocksii]
MSYAYPAIVECILSENLANRSMWDANVPLVVYATSTCYGLDTMGSHIYYQWRRGVGKFIRRDHYDCPRILGPDHVTQQCVFRGTSFPSILRPDDDIDADTNISLSTKNNDFGILSTTGLCDIIHLSIDSVVNTPTLFFYQNVSSLQPHSRKMEETQWEARITPDSTTEEGDEDEDGGQGENVDEEPELQHV